MNSESKLETEIITQKSIFKCADIESDNSNEKEDLKLEPAAEDMDKGKFPSGASMPVTDLYRRKHKTDSKSVPFTSASRSYLTVPRAS